MGTIVSVQSFSPDQISAIQAALPDFGFVDASGLDAETARKQLKSAEIILGWNRDVKKTLFEEGIALKWLQNLGAGVDHIPLDRIQALGAVLTNASGVHPFQISESIFAMLLSLTRGVHRAVRSQLERKWQPSKSLGEAHGKTIAIVGAGAIGLETAKIAKAFGMRVIGVRRSGAPAEGVDEMADLAKLNEVLAQSDYVINCLPLTSETRFLFGQAEFEAMKPTAYYINIGRGATTDTAALLSALRDGRIAGAGLDVFEQEPLPEDHPLWTLENVILTPHEAGNTDSYIERALDIVLDNLAEYRSCGSPKRNVVDLNAQY
ncbi:D-2-hydroxyacid dehydrogenase [Paenibacillus sacheonensis]|uniref:NAD-binding protein n=1 Tax=Paenibacillus sacheonensis TaxID=742054 RepID=A0A7X4YNA5_9BACL|nr:D-2-hydroxyacid dehydrogenase [Paenibacillus sacheonensis]MBM7565607.1 phosphoglycerate dehydrogenase-like enzyme [Paenibacillus sacheonensis]NBC69475.1 NAD-binding protein [Paenibacillus sacheonensis]